MILSLRNPLGAGGGNSRGVPVSPQGTFELRNVVPGSTRWSPWRVSREGLCRSHAASGGSANIEGISITIHAPVTITGHVIVDGETTANLTRVHVRPAAV